MNPRAPVSATLGVPGRQLSGDLNFRIGSATYG
jgi:hypothetical protein